MLQLPFKQRNEWLKAYKSELKNLIVDNETFAIETPRKGERVIPTKPVLAVTSNGTISDALTIKVSGPGQNLSLIIFIILII